MFTSKISEHWHQIRNLGKILLIVVSLLEHNIQHLAPQKSVCPSKSNDPSKGNETFLHGQQSLQRSSQWSSPAHIAHLRCAVVARMSDWTLKFVATRHEKFTNWTVGVGPVPKTNGQQSFAHHSECGFKCPLLYSVETAVRGWPQHFYFDTGLECCCQHLFPDVQCNFLWNVLNLSLPVQRVAYSGSSRLYCVVTCVICHLIGMKINVFVFIPWVFLFLVYWRTG